MSEVSPFWFRATGADSIVSDEPAGEQAAVVQQASAANLPLIPAVRDGMPARAMAALLADPAQRGRHVAALVRLVETNGYAGIDLDYEQFAFADGTASWASTRPAWVAFVSELGAALHSRAKLLTVTTPPIYNGTRAAGSGYWVYDWAGIANHIDRLRIMAYDFSFSPAGPMAPLWWVQQIVAHAVKVVRPGQGPDRRAGLRAGLRRACRPAPARAGSRRPLRRPERQHAPPSSRRSGPPRSATPRPAR